MTKLPISYVDLVDIIRACGPVGPEDCRPNQLRPVMVSQLAHFEPRLAARVRQFDAEQMQAVCAYIFEGMQLVAVPSG